VNRPHLAASITQQQAAPQPRIRGHPHHQRRRQYPWGHLRRATSPQVA